MIKNFYPNAPNQNLSDFAIDSNALYFYLENLGILEKMAKEAQKVGYSFVIDFHISREDFQKKSAEKISKIIKDLSQRGIDFRFYPLPPCFSRRLYSKNVKKYLLFAKSPIAPAFLWGEGFKLKHLHSAHDLEMLKQNFLTLDSKCSFCKLKSREKCRGIYESRIGSYEYSNTRNKWLEEKVSLLKGGRLLDVGCGKDPPFLPLYKKISLRGAKIYLLDPSQSILMTLREVIPKSFHNFIFIQNTAEEMDFGNNFFDIILLTASYSHLQNLKQALLNVRRVMKKNGLLIISDGSKPEYLMNLDGKVGYNEHFRNHNLTQAASVLKKYNFKIMDSLQEIILDHTLWVIKAGK